MSRKNAIIPTLIVSAGDMSQATLTSKMANINFLDNVSIQCNFTGAPVGTFAVQVSNDGVNWTSAGTAPTAPAGSAGSSFGQYTNLAYAFLQVVYTKTSGTGSLNVLLVAKEI